MRSKHGAAVPLSSSLASLALGSPVASSITGIEENTGDGDGPVSMNKLVSVNGVTNIDQVPSADELAGTGFPVTNGVTKVDELKGVVGPATVDEFIFDDFVLFDDFYISDEFTASGGLTNLYGFNEAEFANFMGFNSAEECGDADGLDSVN
jgi:hypothetical protein